MQSNYLDNLLAFFSHPFSIPIFLVCSFIIINKSSYSLWLSFGICSFIVTVVAPPGTFYNLVFPLQEIREFSRPISILFLVAISMRKFLFKEINQHTRKIERSTAFIFLALIVVAVKSIVQGDFLFGLLSLVTVICLFFATQHIWINISSLARVNLALFSISLGGFSFIISCLYQSLFDVNPLIFFNGQFVGLANNPQMAGLILSLSLPSFLFLWESRETKTWLKLFLPIIIVILAYMIFLTGSRTSIFTSLISLIFYYQNRLSKLFQFSLVIVATLFIILLISPDNIFSDTILSTSDLSVNRFTNVTDTRTQVWQNLWSQFLQYPLLGVPVSGQRIGFGESTWLGAAASLGLLGLTPLLLFAKNSILTVWSLNFNSVCSKQAFFRPYLSVVNSSFASIFVSSFAEAYLLGNLAFPIFASLIYILVGSYLSEITTRKLIMNFQGSDNIFALRS